MEERPANGASVPELLGARLRLRRMRRDDVPALFDLQSDPATMRYWSHPPLQRMEQAEENFARNERGFAAGDCLPWALVVGDDDAMVGTCSLFAIDARHRRAMIGYALARRHWGNGYAAEAVRLAIRHAFGPMQLHRLEADIDPRNTASVCLIERLGFSREGLQRERWFVGDEIQDSVLYGLLARDAAAGAPLKR